MTNEEYRTICDKMITSTMQYIDTSKMKRYNIPKRQTPSEYGPIYESALGSKAPITLVYTPSGTGKSALIKERIQAIENTGVPAEKIMLLNMNIAKVKNMQPQLPGVNIMTFSDFVHGIIEANFPELQLSDMTSIANTLELYNQDTLTDAFIHHLRESDPRYRMVLLSTFINNHIKDIMDRLRFIKKSEYALDGMLCQTMMYYFKQNPYDVETILVNGVQNMPVPVLVTLLQYANRFGCNLFLTGCPEETIYEFNMAFADSLNVLSAYMNKQIDIIRLHKTPHINENIKNLFTLAPNKTLTDNSIEAMHLTVSYDIPVSKMIADTMGTKTSYIKDKLEKKEKILILATSKNNVTEIKNTLETIYKPLFPDLNILDITVPKQTFSTYGTQLATHIKDLISKYPNNITIAELKTQLRSYFSDTITATEAGFMKRNLINDMNKIDEFFTQHQSIIGADNNCLPTMTAVQTIIDIESQNIQAYSQYVKNNTVLDMTQADIIVSTIHTAVDIRCDNVITFLTAHSDQVDMATYRVALSRANKSELLIFANYGKFTTIYQQYLQSHLPVIATNQPVKI